MQTAQHVNHVPTNSGSGPGSVSRLAPPASGLPVSYSGRAVFARKSGGPNVLEVREHLVQAPGPGDVVIEVRAAGIAFGDQMLREGLRSEARPPSIPGYDVTGVVLAVGPDATEVAVGAQVVAWTGGSGGYATHVSVPAWAVVEFPPNLRPEVVSSMFLPYLTAYQMLTRAAPLAPGATVLINPASGNVGRALLQLGALRGLRMFGTVSASKAHLLTEMGAVPIDYRMEDYADRIRAEAPEGIDGIFDGIGGRGWGKNLPLLRAGGRLVVYGVTSGMKNGRRDLLGLVGGALRAPRPSYLTYLSKGVGVTGYRIDASIPAHHDWYREDVDALLRLLQEGKITVGPYQTLALEQAVQAHEALGAGRDSGRILLLGG